MVKQNRLCTYHVYEYFFYLPGTFGACKSGYLKWKSGFVAEST